MSSEYSEFEFQDDFSEDFAEDLSQEFGEEEFPEPDLPIWDEDGRIHLTRTTKKGG